MLEKKQGQFWNLHQIPHKTSNPDFRFSSYFFDEGRFSNKNYNYFFLVQKKPEIKKKSKIGIRSFVRNLMQILKLSLFFF